MVASILTIAGCVVVLLLLIMLIMAGILIMRAGSRDSVSAAREDWIQRRSDKDEREW